MVRNISPAPGRTCGRPDRGSSQDAEQVLRGIPSLHRTFPVQEAFLRDRLIIDRPAAVLHAELTRQIGIFMAEIINGRLQLPNVTLCAMTSVKIRETVKAIEYSMRGIDFADALLITDEEPRRLPKGIHYRHTSRLNTIDDFNYKCVYELGDYIETDFMMLVHYDGFIVHPELWRDEFLDYDYIGAPWPLPAEGDDTTYRDKDGNLCRVGNSVGIRSKRLLDFPRQANVPWTPEKGLYNEDGFLCCRIRHLIEAEGMSIAPLDVAKYFSHETMIPEIEGITPFAFHKWNGTNADYPDFRRKHPVMDRVRRLHGRIVNGS